VAKVLITFEDNLLKRIDRTVRERGLTRSAYMAQLAERDLDSALGPGAHPDVRSAFARLTELFAHDPMPEDPTAAVRGERDRRTDRLA
jgi:DNA-binding phage protein